MSQYAFPFCFIENRMFSIKVAQFFPNLFLELIKAYNHFKVHLNSLAYISLRIFLLIVTRYFDLYFFIFIVVLVAQRAQQVVCKAYLLLAVRSLRGHYQWYQRDYLGGQGSNSGLLCANQSLTCWTISQASFMAFVFSLLNTKSVHL